MDPDSFTLYIWSLITSSGYDIVSRSDNPVLVMAPSPSHTPPVTPPTSLRLYPPFHWALLFVHGYQSIYYRYILTVTPGDTTGSYHRAVYSHIFIEYLILHGPVQRQRPSHGTTHTGAVFTRLGILLPQDPSITHGHPSIVTITSLVTRGLLQ